jgi:hypothetical protein
MQFTWHSRRPARHWAGVLLTIVALAACGGGAAAGGTTASAPPVTAAAQPTTATSTSSAIASSAAPTTAAATTASSAAVTTASVSFVPPDAAKTAQATFTLTPHPTPTTGPTPTATPSGQPVAFATIEAMFVGACGGCHPPAQGMMMQPGKVYASIVNVPAVEDKALMRVKPGDSASSYLYLKISQAKPPTGARMPRGQPPLSADEIATVKAWIDQGAKQ